MAPWLEPVDSNLAATVVPSIARLLSLEQIVPTDWTEPMEQTDWMVQVLNSSVASGFLERPERMEAMVLADKAALEEAVVPVKVYSNTGQLVTSESNLSGVETIDLNVQPGVYLIEFEHDGSKHFQQLIVR